MASVHDNMRKLWTDHVGYTRETIKSAINGDLDLVAVLSRLLGNQGDIANAVRPYYGDAAATQLHQLLAEHIRIAAVLVLALKGRDLVRANQLTKDWFANADQIATLLTNMNPAYAPMRQMLIDHLNLTTEEAKYQLAGNWVASITTYDKIFPQALMMADILSAPIENAMAQTGMSGLGLSNQYRG